MAGFLARASRALRDPWSLLVAGVGVGSAWAIGLPAGAVALVGGGMLGVAAVVGGAVRGNDQSGEPTPPPLRPGTVQAQLVSTLRGFLLDLERVRSAGLAPAVAIQAENAVDAARSAERVANRVARAVDAVDEAVGKVQGVARQMPRSDEVRASVQRMSGRRRDLLSKLSAAVDEVGEVYAKLLELSTTADLAGVQTDGSGDAARVNDSLDAVRLVFAELEADASATRALL